MNRNHNLVLKWSTQDHVKINKAAAPIYCWDCPFLTFIYPVFVVAHVDIVLWVLLMLFNVWEVLEDCVADSANHHKPLSREHLGDQPKPLVGFLTYIVRKCNFI